MSRLTHLNSCRRRLSSGQAPQLSDTFESLQKGKQSSAIRSAVVDHLSKIAELEVFCKSCAKKQFGFQRTLALVLRCLVDPSQGGRYHQRVEACPKIHTVVPTLPAFPEQ